MKYKTALLIDDDEDSNFVNNWIIKQSFAENIIIKQSAESALEFLKSKSNSPEDLPDVIFLDIRMPIVDGFGFLERFNKLPETVRNKSKIVMLSSSFDKSDYDRALSNKYVYRYLNKPLSMEALADI